jgi:hypothetical protein
MRIDDRILESNEGNHAAGAGQRAAGSRLAVSASSANDGPGRSAAAYTPVNFTYACGSLHCPSS